MLRWAVIFLVISLTAGALGLANISEFTRKVSFVLCGLFLLGFLVLLGFALLLADTAGGVSLGTDILMAAALIPSQRHPAPAPDARRRRNCATDCSRPVRRGRTRPAQVLPQAARRPKPEAPSRRRTADRERTANLLANDSACRVRGRGASRGEPCPGAADSVTGLVIKRDANSRSLTMHDGVSCYVAVEKK